MARRKSASVNPEAIAPPNNLDAERAVLASCLLRRDAAESALEQLDPEDFWRDAHQRIFRAMGICIERKLVVDLITVHDVLEQRGEAEIVGGRMYIMSLIDGVAITSNVDSYCALLIEMRQRRNLLEIGRQIAGLVISPECEVGALVAEAEAWLANAMLARGSRDLVVQEDIIQSFLPALELRMNRRQELAGITSGYAGINELTRGFHAEDLTIIAARPGMGKSSLMLNMASAAASQDKHVAVFSLEMPRDRVEMRLVAATSQVSMFKLQKGWISEADSLQIGEALRQLSSHPLYIDDTPSTTVAQIRHKCRALSARRGLDIVFIDYVQLLKPRQVRADNRQAEVAEISADLKELARKLRVPVVALSQLSRRVEERPNKRPQLSDLRESGSLEQDADNVAFIYRPEMYTRNAADVGVAEFLLSKHRDGEVGAVELTFRREIVRFFDVETPPSHEPPTETDDDVPDYSSTMYD